MTLMTDRLILRKIVAGDATGLFEEAQNPVVGPLAGWSPHQSVMETERIIANHLSEPGVFGIALKPDASKLIGVISLLKGKREFIPEPEAEVGFWLGETYWGQGLMTEAVERVLTYGFNELKLTKIWCLATPSNLPSQGLQEKVGFTYIETLPEVGNSVLMTREALRVCQLTNQSWAERG